MKKHVIFLSVFFVFIMFNNCFAQNYFKEGTQKYESNDFKGAIIEFEKYIDDNKSSKKLIVSAKVDYAYQIAALSSLYICEFEKSKKFFSELLKRADYNNESKYSGNYSLGFIAYIHNDIQTAITYLNAAIDSYKKNGEAVLLRGICYKQIGNVIDAEKDFNSLLKSNNSDLIMATALFHLDERQKGIAQMNEIIESDPSMLNYYQLASLFAISEDINNATKYLDIALSKGLKSYPVYLFFDRNFDKYLNDSDFNELLKKYSVEDIYKTKNEPIITNNITNNEVKTKTNEIEKIFNNEVIERNDVSKSIAEPETLNEIDEETKKHLQNNQIYGSFLKGTDGTVYLVYRSALYKNNSISGDDWWKISENIKTVSIDAKNQNIFYAIDTTYHVKKSVDGGKSWRVIENGIKGSIAPPSERSYNPIFNPYSLIINPHNTDEIFLLTSKGLYKTNDAGFTWQQLNDKINQRLQIDYFKKDTYYLLARDDKNDLLMSVDGGNTWIDIGEKLPKILVKGEGRTANYKTVDIYNFLFYSDQNDPFLLVFTSNGIYMSNNDGQDWLELNGGLSKNDDIVTACYFSDDGVLIGCGKQVDNNSIQSSIYKLNLLTKNWENIGCKFEGEIISGITKDNHCSGIYVQVSDRLVYIDDALNIIGLNYGVTQHSIVHDINYSFEGNQMILYALVENNNFVDIDRYGIWSSINNGISWSKCFIFDNRSVGLSLTKIGSKKIFISPLNASEIWLLDGRFRYYSTDRGNQWNDAFQYLKSDGYSNDKLTNISFNLQDKNILYFSKGVNEHYLYRFDRTTLNSVRLTESGKIFKVNSENNKKIISENYQVSIDGGWTWYSFREKLKELMSKHIFMNNAVIEPLTYTGDEIRIKLTAGGPSFILTSNDNGVNWSIKNSFDGYIKVVYINLSNPNEMIVIKNISQYSSFKGFSVLLTEDGSKWKEIFNYSMPDGTNSSDHKFYEHYYVNSLIIKSKNRNTIYLSGNGGLIKSDNYGTTWQKMGGINENN